MSARNVRQLLDSIRTVHRQLAERYGELDDAATDERIQLLLEDMEHREQLFENCVAQYVADENLAVLETWLQFVPDEAVHIDHLTERLAEPYTLEELVEETLLLNSSLCDAYLTLAKESPIQALQDLFTDSAQLEERNDCHYVNMLLDS